MERCCGQCEFFMPNTSRDDAGFIGECYRYPPTQMDVSALIQACIDDEDDDRSVEEIIIKTHREGHTQRPVVTEDDWCGEFRLAAAKGGGA